MGLISKAIIAGVTFYAIHKIRTQKDVDEVIEDINQPDETVAYKQSTSTSENTMPDTTRVEVEPKVIRL